MPRAWTSSKWSWRSGQMPISAPGITPYTIKLVPLPEVIGNWGRRERAPDMYFIVHVVPAVNAGCGRSGQNGTKLEVDSIICRRDEASSEPLCKWIDKMRRQPAQS